MGCGASATSESDDTGEANGSNVNNNKNAQNGHVDKVEVKSSPRKESSSVCVQSQNSIRKKIHSSPAKQSDNVRKSVAFEIDVEQNQMNDSLIRKHAPKRLQRLTPLENAPKLTTEQLKQKINQAEEKRQEELEKKKSTAGKSSKLRRQLMDAKRYEEQQEQENQMKELVEKQMSADRNREMKMKEMEDKKKRRKERADKARERATRLKIENGEDIDYEVEKDEGYNADDTDSWLDGESNIGPLQQETSGLSERIYSGRESPHKTIQVRSSAENRARMSAFSTSTSDSFDYAFQRKQPMPPVDIDKRDDFFDS